jgi:hypothetical protein
MTNSLSINFSLTIRLKIARLLAIQNVVDALRSQPQLIFAPMTVIANKIQRFTLDPLCRMKTLVFGVEDFASSTTRSRAVVVGAEVWDRLF